MIHIVVCAKWIPDPEVTATEFKIDPESLRRAEIAGLALVMSPYDEQCFEAALRIREQADEEVKITALCLDTDPMIKLFRQAFSWDVEAGFFLCDPVFEDSDGYTTSFALGTAIQKIGDVDLILTGRQAADGDEGMVGFGIAEHLGIPVLPCAAEVKVQDGSVIIERVLDNGFETLETPLPAVVTVSNEIGEARRPSMRQVMRAARQKPTVWSAEDIGLDAAQLDTSAMRLTVEDIFVPKVDHSCEFITGETPGDLAEALVGKLRELRVIP
ncbi:MAG TPA: electron transfer flavoprotein subunit beta/FixA family protein [Sneathiellales bacterium]|nr:electron transfer flavoprotein subunit beta/FixA family protein [Sneathiellales bacterium]